MTMVQNPRLDANSNETTDVGGRETLARQNIDGEVRGANFLITRTRSFFFFSYLRFMRIVENLTNKQSFFVL